MKSLLVILIFLIAPILSSATAQEGDKLIWKGDTLILFSNPLELRSDINVLRPKLFGNKLAGMSTSCWRGYVAEWIIIDQELYLTNIYSCNYHKDKIKADLGSIFGSYYVNGKVKATWVSGELLIPKGELLHYVHGGYGSFYEKEVVLTFKKAQLKATHEYDNTESHKSIFSQNHDSLQNFIYSNINWLKLPPAGNEIIKVFVSVHSGKEPKPYNVQIVRGAANQIYNKEAVRVIKMLPDWSVYYRRGKAVPVSWTIPVFFDEKLRKQYSP